MKRKLCLLSFIVLFAAGCNTVGLMGKNFGRGLTPHEQAVEQGTEKEVLGSGMGIVSLYFTEDTGTSWRRVEADGTVDPKNYDLTYGEIGIRGRRVSKLLPGTYFLNGVLNAKGISGYYTRAYDIPSFGWNAEKKEARCFSFTVKAGEYLVIPDVYVDFDIKHMDAIESICPFLSVKEQAGNEGSAPYKIGPESRK